MNLDGKKTARSRSSSYDSSDISNLGTELAIRIEEQEEVDRG